MIRHLSFEELHLPPEAETIVGAWLERGDGIAVYENQDMGHPEQGSRKFISFGSPAAQLEVEKPPEQLPDIGSEINWRYRLIGVYTQKDDNEVNFGTLHPDGSVTEPRTIKHAHIRNCPHFILAAEHYREDGSCRCDDPTHEQMSGWGYHWNAQAERWT